MVEKVILTKLAEKQITKAPIEIAVTIQKWVYSIEKIGLEVTRKFGGKGLHDEPLRGELSGLRSIRLNRSWRLYYKTIKGTPRIVSIERVDKHKY